MKFYGRKSNEHVTANRDKVELFIALFKEKLFSDNERAIRVDQNIFSAFQLFSTVELEAAIAEADTDLERYVTLDASTYKDADEEKKAEDEAAAKKAAEEKKAADEAAAEEKRQADAKAARKKDDEEIDTDEASKSSTHSKAHHTKKEK